MGTYLRDNRRQALVFEGLAQFAGRKLKHGAVAIFRGSDQMLPVFGPGKVRERVKVNAVDVHEGRLHLERHHRHTKGSVEAGFEPHALP